jgi:hypothetical protein
MISDAIIFCSNCQRLINNLTTTFLLFKNRYSVYIAVKMLVSADYGKTTEYYKIVPGSKISLKNPHIVVVFELGNFLKCCHIFTFDWQILTQKPKHAYNPHILA